MNKQTAQWIEKHFDTAFAAPDGIKKLRELILTLAMQGRLVPQDPNDQPASELLTEIAAERRRLVKEGKIKAAKPLPEITAEDVPYGLPVGWVWVRLDILTQIITKGSSPKWQGVQYVNEGEGILFITSENVGNYHLLLEKKKYVESKFNEIEPRSLLKKHDILMNIVGASIGRTAIYDLDEIANINQAVTIIRLINFVNYDYFLHFFNSPICIDYMYDKQVDNARPNLSMGNIALFRIPLPPLPEQQRIVAKIDQLMARCDELEKLRAEQEQKRLAVHTSAIKRLIDAQAKNSFDETWQFITRHFGTLYSVKGNVTELRKAILQLSVMGKLVPQDPNDPPASELLKEIEAEKRRLVKEKKIKPSKTLPEIKPAEAHHELPVGWVWARLGNLMLKITDGTHHSPPNSDIGDFLYISAKNIKDDGVLLDNATYVTKEIHEEIFSRCNPEFGNILYIKDGATTGIATINNLKEPFSMLSSVALLKQPLQVSNRFLLFTLRAPFFYQEMRAEMTGVAITRVTLNKLNDALIPVPPLSEQHRIVAKIDQLMSLCDALEQQIDAAAGKQTKLLSALMAEV